MKKRILVVFGTRPEAIKMAPVVHELVGNDQLDCVTCVTGQHREMLDQVIDVFDLKPDFDLNVMTSGQDLYDVTSRVLLGVRDVLDRVKPDVVLVHGDTTTSTTTALSAFYKRIAVGHVEAGLRTQDIYNPWPEEMNRRLTGRLATHHFAPTESARRNLAAEGVPDDRIVVTGNTVVDALLRIDSMLVASPAKRSELRERLTQLIGFDPESAHFVLVTGHRRENFGPGMRAICEAVIDLSSMHPELRFVYPVHLNPNVQEPVHRLLGGINTISLIEPLDYLSFVYLMRLSHIVLTDSGGIQEEAPTFGKPVLVMRSTTERPEAIEAGTAKLVGTDREKIVTGITRLVESPDEYRRMSGAGNPYGDGRASTRIAEYLATVSASQAAP